MKDGSGCMYSDSQAPVVFGNTITLAEMEQMSAKKASYLSFAILKYVNSEWKIGSVSAPRGENKKKRKFVLVNKYYGIVGFFVFAFEYTKNIGCVN